MRCAAPQNLMFPMKCAILLVNFDFEPIAWRARALAHTSLVCIAKVFGGRVYAVCGLQNYILSARSLHHNLAQQAHIATIALGKCISYMFIGDVSQVCLLYESVLVMNCPFHCPPHHSINHLLGNKHQKYYKFDIIAGSSYLRLAALYSMPFASTITSLHACNFHNLSFQTIWLPSQL